MTRATKKVWSVLLFTLGCALTSALGGCALTTDEAEGVGGETNWLQCGSSGECADGFACRSGQCTPMTSTGEPGSGSGTTASQPGSSPDAMSDVGAGPALGEPPGVVGSAPQTQLGLAACGEAVETQVLVDFRQPQPCAAGTCAVMQGSSVSTLQDGRVLVTATDNTGVSRGTPQVAALDADGQLGTFAALPGAEDSTDVIGAGPYVAALDQPSFLYQWQDGALADIGAPDGISDLDARGESLLVTGFEEPTDAPREPWLAAYAGTEERWRISAPPDAVTGRDAISESVAQDEDGSAAWLVAHHDDQWRLSVVRIDAEGNHLWTTPLDPDAGAQWNSERDDWLLHPGVVSSAGVTSVAGGVNTGSGSTSDLRLTFRQYDATGVEIHRWDGLDTLATPNSTQVVTDGDGNVYVTWTVGTLGDWKLVLLRFSGNAEPCVLAEVPNQLPTGLALRGDDVVFATREMVRSVPRL